MTTLSPLTSDNRILIYWLTKDT